MSIVCRMKEAELVKLHDGLSQPVAQSQQLSEADMKLPAVISGTKYQVPIAVAVAYRSA